MDSGYEKRQPYGGQKSMSRQLVEMLVILIAAAAVFSFFNLRKETDASVFSFGADSFTFSPCEEAAATVVYGDIVNLALIDTPASFGVCRSGGTRKGLVYGSWQDAGGEALVYVQTGLPGTILLETAQQKLMFNFTDEKSTEALYASLWEVWQETSAGASESVQTGE